jgi:hypothetical protein
MNILKLLLKKKTHQAPRVRNAQGMYARKVIIKEYGQEIGYYWAEPKEKGVKYVGH